MLSSSSGELYSLKKMYFATESCNEFRRKSSNISRNDLLLVTPGISLSEAYIIFTLFGIIVLILSYAFVMTRKRFFKDQVSIFDHVMLQ